MTMSSDINGAELLAPVAGDRLVSFAYVAAAIRRRWRPIVGVAATGMILGVLLGVAVPKSHSATSSLFLQFPAGSDPGRAMSTDLSLLQTRAVAASSQKTLRLSGPPEGFLSVYRGKILSDGVMQITAKGPSSATAVARTIAVDNAFLAFRKTVYLQQLLDVQTELTGQQADLQKQVNTVTKQIENFDPATAPAGTGIDDLVSERSGLNSQIQSIEGTIQSDQIATATVIQGSRIIDPASAIQVSTKRMIVFNAASGLIAGLAMALGVVTLIAVASTRVRRRSDIASALRAPVAVSVGPIIRPRWRRIFLPPADPFDPAKPNVDLQLVVRHLRSALDSAATPALAVVAIDNVPAAALAVQSLQKQLAGEGYRASIINETGRELPGGVVAIAEPPSDRGGAIAWNVVLVLATLDPMKGADHLRDLASDAVVMVTAGLSSATKVEANAIMIRSAGLRLRSAVLIATDPTDDSLGIFEERPVPTIGRRPVGLSDPASAKRSS
jgi:hypothetical protein